MNKPEAARPSRFVAWAALAAVSALAGCAAHPVKETRTDSGSPISVPLEVLRPAGSGPFPAIVMLHNCSGLGPRSSGAPRRWAKEFLARGYVVAIPDSFSTRGFPNGVCTEQFREAVGPFSRIRDAYETLDHLRTLPFVDGKRIGAMGGSHGGSTTLASLAANSSFLAQRKNPGFVAATALYPNCSIGNPSFKTHYRPVAPLLILTGELDDWTPAAPCRELSAVAQNAGGNVTLKVYPGAHHSFDSHSPVRYVETRMNATSPTGRGATTGGNAEAWADSIREVSSFFAREFGRVQ